MALFDGLLGGGSTDPYDLYGDILTAKQREALRARSSDDAWANTANFLAKAAMPTNKRTPLGGLLAGLAGSMRGGPQDEAVLSAMKGSELSAKIAKLRREQKLLEQLDPIQAELLRRQLGLGAGRGPASTTTPPAATTTPPASAAKPPVPPTDFSEIAGPASWATTPPPMIVPPVPPAPAGGFPAGSGVPPGAMTSNTPPGGGLDMPGLLALANQASGDDGGIFGQLASLYGGGGGGSGAPFDMASLGPSTQGLPDVGPVQVEALSGEAAPVRPAPGDRSDAAWEYYKPTIKKYESGNRNIEQQVVPRGGGYNPSTGTVTGWSSASGPLQMLDSTFQNTARKAGIDISGSPRAMNAPEAVQDEVGKALFKAEGLRPWAAYNTPLARATGYTGPMANRGNSGFSGRIEPLGGEAVPAGGSGLVPGLGISPEALATLNSMYEAAGVDAPFKSLLDTYYKSPGYLREKATTEKTAEAEVNLEYGPKIKKAETEADLRAQIELRPKLEAEIAWAKVAPNLDEHERKAVIDRLTKAKEQIGDAQKTQVDAKVYGPDGKLYDRKMTMFDFMERERAAGNRANAARERGEIYTPQPGDVAGSPILSKTEEALGPVIAKAFGEQREAAAAAAKQIKINNESLRLLDSGIYTGWDANLALGLARVFGVSGRDNKEKVANTQLFIIQRMQDAAEAVKAQPGSASDKDVAFMERMALGNITLEPETIREGLEIYNRYNRERIREHNRNAAGIRPEVTAGIRQTIDEPPVYERRTGETPDKNRWQRPR